MRRGAGTTHPGRFCAIVLILAGVSPSGKAAGFDPAIRRFESFHPSQLGLLVRVLLTRFLMMN
jgi:hypothetical protein